MSAATAIAESSVYATGDIARQVLAKLLPHLKWRHHTLGILQAYLQESDVGLERRVHIWHPALVTAPAWREIHDHRFNFESDVLVGQVFHHEKEVYEDVEGACRMYSVIPAREAAGSMPDPTELPGRFHAYNHTHVISAGQRYSFKARAFHSSSVTELTVTVLTKQQPVDKDNARLLVPLDKRPTFGVTPNVDPAWIERYVSLAQTALLAYGHGR